MKTRLDYGKHSPRGVEILMELEKYVHSAGLEHSLIHLVKLRASQLNGCAFCIDMHAREAREHGESDRRLHLLSACRESGVFDARECAALAWTEALTRLEQSQVSDAVYDEVRAQFSEAEIVELSMAIVAINGWNRLSVAFRTPPGIHTPA